MKLSTKVLCSAVIAVATVVVGGMSMDKSANTQDIALANIEALAENEIGTGSSIPCHSSATRDYNKAYVDCASCTRQEGWKGTGTQATCVN